MPALSPTDTEAFLERHWPDVMARLGDRRAAFLQRVREGATARGFMAEAQVARFANLCFAFGVGFETRTEHEWALAILLDERLSHRVKLHQLVQRGAAELERRGGDGTALAGQLRAVDGLLLNAVDAAQIEVRGPVQLLPPGYEPTARVACDIEAVELRLLDTDGRQEYRRIADGSWTRAAVTAPAPLRIGAGHPAPDAVHLLSGAAGDDARSRLQVRQVTHGRCGLGLHPALQWTGGDGSERWVDPAARSVAWTLGTRRSSEVPQLLAEAAPEPSLLEVPSCGLRDEGVPIGALRLPILTYPAWQWLHGLERQAPLGFELPDARSAPPAAAPTRLRCERDGQPVAVDRWQQGFDVGLLAELDGGLQRLLQTWRVQVQEPSLRAEFGLFDGKATLTWGWREGPRGLAAPPLQRVVAELDLAARCELHLQGLVEYAGARARLHLRIEGQARLQTEIERLLVEAPLQPAMQAATLRWRWPVLLDDDPVADGGGCVFSEIGPVSGALVGSLGLRPSPTQGGAWEWFATLALEPVATRVVVHDPLLGRSESHMALLGSQTLLDWSVA